MPMAVDIPALKALQLVKSQTVTPRDVMLYALGIGLGADPLDEQQLRYVFEDGLQALPSMAITLTYPELLAAYGRVGIAKHRVLHGEQRFTLARPLPVQAELQGTTRVVQLVDKGPGKGLLVYYQTEVHEVGSAQAGEPLALLTGSTFCVDEGGACPGEPAAAPLIERHASPTTAPDGVCDLPTLPQAALIYRLSGDYNPLHASPAVARSAGHDRPILHGRCTFGVAGHALLRLCCDYDARRLLGMTARFIAPVYPGETIRTEVWRTAQGVLFRARALERDRVVLDNGHAQIID
ncbi:MAG: MaoC/PaaZ C-terminal domain-containing protein [Burkholderiales bacterium]